MPASPVISAFSAAPNVAIPSCVLALNVGIKSAPPVLGMNWYVRVGGSNNNGGSDTSLTALRTGTDGVTNATTTFTSASAAFTQADVGRGICINTGANARHHKIVAVVNTTTVTLDRINSTSSSGLTWAIGGAWANFYAPSGSTVANADSTNAMSPGDTCWIGAGVYRNNANAVTFGTIKRVRFIGDVYGQQTGDVGMVRISSQASDTAADYNNGASFSLSAACEGITFENIVFGPQSQGAAALNLSSATFTTLRRCSFEAPLGANSGNSVLTATTAIGKPLNLTIDRCICFQIGSIQNQGIYFFFTRSGYNVDHSIVISNCLMFGSQIRVDSAGAGAGFCGGVRIRNCTDTSTNTTDANLLPRTIDIQGSMCGSTLTANAAGQVVENWNLLYAPTARTNVAAGGKTVATAGASGPPYELLRSQGQEFIWAGTQRPFNEPWSPSGLIRFGVGDTAAGPFDLLGRPRPSASAAWDVGAIQRWNNAVQTTIVTQAGGSALQVMGFGGEDLNIPVDATPTTFSIYVRYDSNYVGPLPQLVVCNAGQVGIGDYTVVTSKQSLNAWAQYSVTINPTAKGIVTLRLAALDTSGVGNTYFDTLLVTAA